MDITAIGNLVEHVRPFLEKLLGESLQEGGGLLADRVHYWRWRHRCRIAEKAREIVEANDLTMRLVPQGFLLEFLEAAGNVEDPGLQELWAHLLASSIEDDKQAHPNLIHTLRRMNGEDARVFLDLASRGVFVPDKGCARIVKIRPQGEDDLAISRLIGLNLLFETEHVHTVKRLQGAEWRPEVEVTEFGRQFAAALGLFRRSSEKQERGGAGER